MKTWKKTFLFPTAMGKKVTVQARFIDHEDDKKPEIQVLIKSQIHKNRMKAFDYRLLTKILEDMFTYLRKGSDRDVDDYLETLDKQGGPKIPLKEKLRIGKDSFKRAWKKEDLTFAD